MEQVTSILSRVHGIDLTGIIVRRLCKYDAGNKPRPLLVRLSSADEVLRILRNRHVLPPMIQASSDKTAAERTQLKALIEEVTHHNKANPNNKKKIKYVNSILTIVDDVCQHGPTQHGSKNKM